MGPGALVCSIQPPPGASSGIITALTVSNGITDARDGPFIKEVTVFEERVFLKM